MTMTDNDDPAAARARSSAGLSTEARREGIHSGEDRATRWTRDSHAAAEVGPTDPEVPSAKRRGVLRRQRSLVGLTAIIVGLLSTTLALLYRASQRVGVDENGNDMRWAGDNADAAAASAGAVHDGTPGRRSPPAPVGSGSELDDDTPAEDSVSTDSAPAGSTARPPKRPSRAHDIIRTPAF